MSKLTLVNGQFCDHLSVNDRGLAYGDGVFDTMLVKNGEPVFYQQHLQRLFNDCQRLGITIDRETVEKEMAQLLQSSSMPSQAILKTIITRGQGQRGYAISKGAAANRILTLSSLPASLSSTDDFRLTICDTRLNPNAALAGVKHLSRLENVLARKEWRAKQVDEGLMLDISGNVIEGTMSNVFWVKDGVVYTPALGRCGVAGILRQIVIEQLAPVLKLLVREGDYKLDALYQADELFVTNNLIGVRVVKAIGCHLKNSDNPITQQLQKTLEALHA